MNKSSLVTIRDWSPGDRNFILATWLKGLKYGNDWFGLIDSDAYYKSYHPVISAILDHPKTTVRIAALIEDPEVILGYAVCTGDKLHWVHVKRAWRGIGIARDLIPSNISTVTHLTDAGRGMLRKHPNVRFIPFNLF